MKSKNDVSIEAIKKCALKGIVSGEQFREMLVLKGGNAIDLVHDLGSRASIDLDFSMQDDFEEVERVAEYLEANLVAVFKEMGLQVFDFKMEPKPTQLSADVADFWGGYKLSFKLIEEDVFVRLSSNLDKMRVSAINVTPAGAKSFKIDISKYECCSRKELYEIDDYSLYVYSIPMIAAEKLRAICQQMDEYKPIVKRTRPGAARARDFLDLHGLVSPGYVNPDSLEFLMLLQEVFDVKRVPVSFIGKIKDSREFHRVDFQSVIDTVKPDQNVEDFDFYFDFVCQFCQRLESLWNV